MASTNVIKVAQIIGRTINGGVENLIYNYYLNIDKTKFQYDFFVEEPSDIINVEKIEKMGGRVVIIPSYKKIFKYTKVLKKMFIEGKYDIVQANMNSLSVFSLRAAKKAKINVRICNSLSTSNKKEKLHHLLKMLLRPFSKKYATHYFACSNLCGEWLYGKKILANQNYYKINNAIQYERYLYNETYRKELKNKHGLTDEFIVGTIGRLEPQKNQMFLLDIFAAILKYKQNSKLIIIGDGYLFDDLNDKINKLNLKDNVIILTSKEVGVRGSALKYYSLFDCFVLPSLYEGLPTVGIEAQINTLPCFMSNTITTETKISDRCEFIPLDAGSDEWAKTIIDNSNVERTNKFECQEYDVKVQAKLLEELYSKFLQEER